MKIIVVSSMSYSDNEYEVVERLFQEGLEYFHVRKPYFSEDEYEKYIKEFKSEYHNRMVLHAHYNFCLKYDVKGIHISRKYRKRPFKRISRIAYLRYKRSKLHVSISYHRLSEINKLIRRYSYIFLSPVFDSISKSKYKAAFEEEKLKKILKKTNQEVIALGGVDLNNIDQAKELGFSGVALLGSIWNSKDPVAEFIKIRDKCSKLEAMS